MCEYGWRACVNMQSDVCVCGGEYAGGVGAVPVQICCVAVRACAVCGVSAGCVLSAACVVSVRSVKYACVWVQCVCWVYFFLYRIRKLKSA